MKPLRLFILFAVFFIVKTPQLKAVIMPTLVVNADSMQFHNRIHKANAYFFKKKTEQKEPAVSQIAKGFTFLHLFFMVLIPIVGFQSKLIVAAVGLLLGLLALILALVGVAIAKDEASKKAANKSLRIVFGIILGVVLISLIVLRIIGVA